MDDHIEELFQKVFAADDGSWCKDPEYEKALTEAFDLEYLMKLLHGPTAHKLLTRFLDAYRIVEHFHYCHYFRQGYLAAREGFGVPDMAKMGALLYKRDKLAEKEDFLLSRGPSSGIIAPNERGKEP